MRGPNFIILGINGIKEGVGLECDCMLLKRFWVLFLIWIKKPAHSAARTWETFPENGPEVIKQMSLMGCKNTGG